MIPSGVEIFLGLSPIDLRWGFDRLAGLVEEQIGRAARSGALFVFFGKRRSALKILFFDGGGLCQFYNHPSSYCTSFGSRSVSCSLVCWVSCGGRAIDESIPSAGVLLGQVLRFFVEPTVLRVRVRFDEPVFNPSDQCMLVNFESCCHLLLREHASLAESCVRQDGVAEAIRVIVI
jgi:hypothetical protein